MVQLSAVLLTVMTPQHLATKLKHIRIVELDYSVAEMADKRIATLPKVKA
jgi:hypothetical protein